MASRLFLRLGNRRSAAALLGIASLQLGLPLAGCEREGKPHESQEPGFKQGHHSIHRNKPAVLSQEAGATAVKESGDVASQRSSSSSNETKSDAVPLVESKGQNIDAKQDAQPANSVAAVADESSARSLPSETESRVSAPAPKAAPATAAALSWRQLLDKAEASHAAGKEVKASEWNTIMKAMGSQNEWKEVLTLFKRVRERHQCDGASYYLGMLAAATLGDANTVQECLRTLEHNIASEPTVTDQHYPPAIYMQCKQGNIKEALALLDKQQQLFQSLNSKNRKSILLSHRYILEAMMIAKEWKSAVELLRTGSPAGDGSHKGFVPDVKCYAYTAQACLSCGEVEEGMRLLKEMHTIDCNEAIPPGVYMQPIKTLSKLKRWKEIHTVLELMENRSIVAKNSHPYESAMVPMAADGPSAWDDLLLVASKLEARQLSTSPYFFGDVFETLETKDAPAEYRLKLLEGMTNGGGAPPGLLYYNHVLEKLADEKNLEKCMSIVDSMERNRQPPPNQESYNILMHCAGKCLKCDESHKVLSNMLLRGHLPSKDALDAAVYACAAEGRAFVAWDLTDMQERCKHEKSYDLLLSGYLVAFRRSAVKLKASMYKTIKDLFKGGDKQ